MEIGGGEPGDIPVDILAGGAIIIGTIDEVVQWVQSKSIEDDLDKVAQDVISDSRRGSINRVFPDEFRDVIVREIEKAAQAGDKKAQTALKLLRDARFAK